MEDSVITGPDITLRVLWKQFLEAELKYLDPDMSRMKIAATDLDEKMFDRTLVAIQQCMSIPVTAPVPTDVFSCWVYFAGERIAKDEEYMLHANGDALRYYAFDKKNMDFEKAMALSDAQLAAMFGDMLNCLYSNGRYLKSRKSAKEDFSTTREAV